MGRLGIIAILLVVVIGAGLVYINFWVTSPTEVAQSYLDTLEKGSFNQMIELFHSKPFAPSAEDLQVAFDNFSTAFGLQNIEVVEIESVKEGFFEAEYTYTLKYTSDYFEPIVVQNKLFLGWDGLLKWKIIWQDDLPLPSYGLSATYSRTRIESARGDLYDRHGQLLAGIGSYITIGVQPERINDSELLLSTFQETLGLSPAYVQAQYQAAGVQGHWFVPIISISERKYQEVDPILRPIPGVFFRREEVRGYPSGEALGHITGYLGEITPTMMEQYPERDYRVGEIVGRSGLEYSLESRLRGRPGYQFYVYPPVGARELLAERKVVQGEDLQLTIDANWQELAYEVLEDQVAAFVLIDADTGELLVLVSTPSYDPNEFILGISSQRWQELSNDPTLPMFNRTLQGLYPPGSVFKVLTVMAAVNEGLYQIDDLFEDTGELRIDGNVIRNYANQVFGEHTLEEALVKSVNTTIVKVGLELGASSLEEYFTLLKLDQEPKLNLPAKAGQIGRPSRSRVGLAWTAIGQDQVLLTPMQVARIFTVLGNQGQLPALHLLADTQLQTGESVITEETAEVLNQVLAKVVTEGTGQQANVAGLDIRGKTGTAEASDGVTHAWFGGTATLSGKNLAFALLVEDSGLGGTFAAPLISELFSQFAK